MNISVCDLCFGQGNPESFGDLKVVLMVPIQSGKSYDKTFRLCAQCRETHRIEVTVKRDGRNFSLMAQDYNEKDQQFDFIKNQFVSLQSTVNGLGRIIDNYNERFTKQVQDTKEAMKQAQSATDRVYMLEMDKNMLEMDKKRREERDADEARRKELDARKKAKIRRRK